MARPRLELLARHAAVLFVEVVTGSNGRNKSEILLGAHMSIGGGVHTAIERGRSIKCTAIQMFVKNNMQWFARPLRTRRNPRLPRTSTTRRVVVDLCPRQLSDQSRGHKSAIPRQFHSPLVRGPPAR